MVVGDELGGRKIERQGERMRFGRQRFPVGNADLEHRLAELDDHAILFRHGHEHFGRDESPCRVMPVRQSFSTDDAHVV